jgi:hypothetical protein
VPDNMAKVLRDFDVADLDGNMIFFDLASQKAS